MFSAWAAEGVMPFVVEQATNIPFVVGQAAYTVPVGTLAVLDPVFIRDDIASPIQIISRSDYQMIPNKETNGQTSQLFFNRPTRTAYCWPRGEDADDALGYWRLRRAQDVSTAGETADVPYQGFDALVGGLAARMALIYNPQKFAVLDGLAGKAFDLFADMERERADVSFGIRGL